jgi:ribosomal-protein-alanine N-acetyltransferase
MFETSRLLVRKFREEDARPLYENHRDAEVRKWFPNECYADEAEAQDAIRFYANCVDGGRLPFVLAVELKETGELIGDTGISEVEGKPDEAEVGYCIGEKYRGRGYAPELLDAITGYVGSRFGIRVIYGRVVHGNEASAKVLGKDGYEFVREEFGAEDDPYGNGMLVFRKNL